MPGKDLVQNRCSPLPLLPDRNAFATKPEIQPNVLAVLHNGTLHSFKGQLKHLIIILKIQPQWHSQTSLSPQKITAGTREATAMARCKQHRNENKMTWFQILNPPLNSFDLGQVVFTSQLSSCVTREYYLLHSLVVFRNEAMHMKSPGGKAKRRERRREGGRHWLSWSSISRNIQMEFSTEVLA